MKSRAVKLDDETYERLKTLGELRRRSPHLLMKKAIRQFIDREEGAERIREAAMKPGPSSSRSGTVVKISPNCLVTLDQM